MTRRCGKAIVKEANKIVADFHAFETNGEGKVSSAKFDGIDDNRTYRGQVKPSDMLLCRVTAPLVSECFRFIKAGRTANIRGRDIGEGLIKTVDSMMKGWKGVDEQMVHLMQKLDKWLEEETRKEQAKKFPNDDKIIALHDKYDCIVCFMEGCSTAQHVKEKIAGIFTDERKEGAIQLSTIHKAKGLESKRVFFLMPKGAACPHPMAKTEWQIEQEYNLKYVAITRAIEELVYVY